MADVSLTWLPVDGSARVYAVIRDITERDALLQSKLLASEVFDNSLDAIMISAMDQKIIAVNKSFERITGYAAQEVLGKTMQEACSPYEKNETYSEIWRHLEHNDRWQGELIGQRLDGSSYPQWLQVIAVRDKCRNINNCIGMFSDITDRKASEARTRHMIEYDYLTDLPNRVLLLDRLGQALDSAKRTGTRLAILFLDLDRFKNINDSLGHHIGDSLLKMVAERLKQCVRSIDTVSRQGGGEFIILLVDIDGIEDVAHIAGTVLKSITKPYQIDEFELNISTSVGVSIYPEDGLKKAIVNHEFRLFYPPEVDRISGKIVGADAADRPKSGSIKIFRWWPMPCEHPVWIPNTWSLNSLKAF